MSEAVTIDSAPRDPNALMSMSGKQRASLYKELCVFAGKRPSPAMREFKRLEEIKQVQFLLNHLLAYDRATAGYRVEQAILPVRTKQHQLNVKRMEQFSVEVEDLLNSMANSGHQATSLIHFGEHGILAVGYKPPPSQFGVFLQPAGSPPPQLAPGSPTFDSIPQQAQESVQQHFCADLARKLIALVGKKRQTHGKVTKKDVDEIVVENTKALGAEGLGSILSVLADLMNEHKEAHQQGDGDPAGCEFTTEFKLLHTAVKQRIRMQLS